jgi:hypothetical protein
MATAERHPPHRIGEETMARINHHVRLTLVAVALAAFFVQLDAATQTPSPFADTEQASRPRR